MSAPGPRADMPPALLEALDASLGRPVPAGARALASHFRDRHGDNLRALLFYGSCFRRCEDRDGLLDFYLLVDDYRQAHGSRRAAWANRLLPPNVYYLELPFEGRVLRSKYGVVSLAQLQRLVRPDTLQGYFWGRLAQPCGLLACRDDATREAVRQLLGQAVMTLLGAALPLQPPGRHDALAIWQEALLASYGTELRPERPQAVRAMTQQDEAHYRRLCAAAAGTLPGLAPTEDGTGDRYEVRPHAATARRARRRWRLRALVGRTLNVARILKAAFTFSGGADYLLWKIERHSGVRLEPTPLLRRAPLLGIWGLAWRAWRRGVFR